MDEGFVAAMAVPNVVRNQKYRAATFVFEVLYEQFRFFFNLYFLLVALSQFIPELQVSICLRLISRLRFLISV
jgi:phospholipid-translocating ATPase